MNYIRGIKNLLYLSVGFNVDFEDDCSFESEYYNESLKTESKFYDIFIDMTKNAMLTGETFSKFIDKEIWEVDKDRIAGHLKLDLNSSKPIVLNKEYKKVDSAILENNKKYFIFNEILDSGHFAIIYVKDNSIYVMDSFPGKVMWKSHFDDTWRVYSIPVKLQDHYFLSFASAMTNYSYAETLVDMYENAKTQLTGRDFDLISSSVKAAKILEFALMRENNTKEKLISFIREIPYFYDYPVEDFLSSFSYYRIGNEDYIERRISGVFNLINDIGELNPTLIPFSSREYAESVNPSFRLRKVYIESPLKKCIYRFDEEEGGVLT